MDNLVVDPKALVFFIDDTGHETFAGTERLYGLGGCAVMGRDLDRLIVQPWLEVREKLLGSRMTHLHASSLAKVVPDIKSASAIIGQFFRENRFYRFASTISATTGLPATMTAVQAMRHVLENRIDAIVARTLCREVKVVFEASDRADPLIEAAFQGLQARRGTKELPTECFFKSKEAGDPGHARRHLDL